MSEGVRTEHKSVVRELQLEQHTRMGLSVCVCVCVMCVYMCMMCVNVCVRVNVY